MEVLMMILKSMFTVLTIIVVTGLFVIIAKQYITEQARQQVDTVIIEQHEEAPKPDLYILKPERTA